jgi:hypothetical protein
MLLRSPLPARSFIVPRPSTCCRCIFASISRLAAHSKHRERCHARYHHECTYFNTFSCFFLNAQQGSGIAPILIGEDDVGAELATALLKTRFFIELRCYKISLNSQPPPCRHRRLHPQRLLRPRRALMQPRHLPPHYIAQHIRSRLAAYSCPSPITPLTKKHSQTTPRNVFICPPYIHLPLLSSQILT